MNKLRFKVIGQHKGSQNPRDNDHFLRKMPAPAPAAAGRMRAEARRPLRIAAPQESAGRARYPRRHPAQPAAAVIALRPELRSFSESASPAVRAFD